MFETKIQIRFGDTDMLGHVNNVNLQHYFDLGKSSYMRQVLGVQFPSTEVGFIAKTTHNVYETPTFFNDSIAVRTWVAKVGNKSITIKQQIVDLQDGTVKANSESVMVCYDFTQDESMNVPEAWRRAIAEQEAFS